MIRLFIQFRTWWLSVTAPKRVEQELAWRGYILNSLLLASVIFAVPFFIFNVVLWTLNLESGGAAVVTSLFFFAYIILFWVSKRKSISLAILGFSLLNILLSLLLSLGWGLTDITVSAIYAAAIIEISLLMRGRTYVVIITTLLTGYIVIGWLQLNGWLVPPFYTDLSANYLTMISFLIFLSFLGAITAGLISRVLRAQVTEVTQREQLESHTRIATQIQLSMLPTVPPNHRNFELSGQSIPSRDVGGDFYSYHKLLNDELAVVVGDVAGKGVPAALLMAVTTGIVDSLTPTFGEPIELLAAIGIRLRKYLSRSHLNAACLAAFFKDSKLCVVNAGCLEPLIRRNHGQVEWLTVGGLPLGLEVTPADLRRRKAETTLTYGDMVILMTDGVVEAKNKARQMLGFSSLETIVATGPDHSAEAMKLHILDKVEAHRGEAEQDDDVTVVVVRFKENSTDVTQLLHQPLEQ